MEFVKFGARKLDFLDGLRGVTNCELLWVCLRAVEGRGWSWDEE